ncbi:hypothetical protein OAQ85_00555 [Schleiferiaceae bacterium]|jgi:hypothetical protein|nr:hypothetical protein [Schleiferiaceae bacterium]
MDLKIALNEFSIDKDQVYREWIKWATENPEKLQEVMERAFNGNDTERKRASWILHHVSDRRPELFYVKEKMMIDQLEHTETQAEIRFILRYYSKYRLPRHEEREGVLADYCFKVLMIPNDAVAPQVYSMSVLHKLTIRYPELAHELEESIRWALENGSAGMISRGNKILQDLQRRGLI